MNFMRENFPSEAVARILAGLPETDRRTLSQPILMSAWYRAGILCSIMHAMAKKCSERPDDLFFRLGRQSCDDGLNTLTKIFFKMLTPSFILKHVGQIRSNYYDSGTMVILDSSPIMGHRAWKEPICPMPPCATASPAG